MDPARRQPSHPLTGWAFVAIGCVGLVSCTGYYLARCSAGGIPAWPVRGAALEVLADVVRLALPAGVLTVLGVLLPLQRFAMRPERRTLVARLVTGALLAVAGGYWLARLNLVGFASLWSREELLGELVLPAALLENRVWSANIMVVLVVAMLSLPLNALVRRLLDRPALRRAPWPLWALASAWWIGVAVLVLLAGAR